MVMRKNRPRAQITATFDRLCATDPKSSGIALSVQSIKDGGSSVKKLNGSLQREGRFTDWPVSFQGPVRCSSADSVAHPNDPVIFYLRSVHRRHISPRISHFVQNASPSLRICPTVKCERPDISTQSGLNGSNVSLTPL